MARIDLSKFPYEVKLAAHAIGLDLKNPYTRHGRLFYSPYRNYFAVSENNDRHYGYWLSLSVKGFADFYSTPGGHYVFWLTRQGLDWLGEQLGMTIHDEED